MSVATIRTLRALCKRYGVVPQRSSGQNFLISAETLDCIVTTAEVSKSDTVLEIGPGFGALTEELCARASRVFAVELDQRLIAALHDRVGGCGNCTLIGGDIFQQWPALSPRLHDLRYKVVANVPYNITSLVLRSFLERTPRPSSMTLLVQREVAERVTAGAGKMSVLSVAVQFFGNPRIVEIVPPDCFWPEPEVDSAVLKIDGIGADAHGYLEALQPSTASQFFSVVRTGYAARRKQLHNNIASGLRLGDDFARTILQKAGIDPMIRAQNLSVGDWIKITHEIRNTRGVF
ncbi:MAG: 16S rRNA (adenine(1518)-N(6)/adenine(1519)-N(6))-dimethyltransferase RsmA [Patescibacteria group bacterium]|nr:16S rRNA (adenine(1518)-N(6)/adenine(1519)-N(6))-dimethyltransferase RsmA [Patescibacteria group bacterium]MDD5715492.1 16S rRNA (adenine(1518)-N(6)/adenine(1519)-N(6))-dimethyltransferase RsmA [Patescibacteria group bacterium]